MFFRPWRQSAPVEPGTRSHRRVISQSLTNPHSSQISDRHTDRRQTDRQTEDRRQTDRQTDTQTDTQTDRYTDRQTDRQTDRIILLKPYWSLLAESSLPRNISKALLKYSALIAARALHSQSSLLCHSLKYSAFIAARAHRPSSNITKATSHYLNFYVLEDLKLDNFC